MLESGSKQMNPQILLQKINCHQSGVQSTKLALSFIIAFQRWMRSPTSFIEGPLIRNFFETLCGESHIDTATIRLTAVYCDRPENKFMVNASWNDLVNSLTIIASLTKLSIDFPGSNFGGWQFQGINVQHKEMDESPEAELVFNHGPNSWIVVQFLAWRDKSFVDFDVNGLCFCNEGFVMKNTGGFTACDALEGIINREASYVKRADILQNSSFPTEKSVSRNTKQKYLSAIYDLISNKWLKIKQAGYKIVGKQPDMYIEKEEECFVTGRKPNYPCVRLQCGHSLSIMAYKGIISSNNEYTESVKCPMCRADLLIKFSEIPKTKISLNIPEIPNTFDGMGHKRGTTISSTLLSSDALDGL